MSSKTYRRHRNKAAYLQFQVITKNVSPLAHLQILAVVVDISVVVFLITENYRIAPGEAGQKAHRQRWQLAIHSMASEALHLFSNS